MKRLVLVRHAKAKHESYAGSDMERPLNERGRGDAAKMGLRLADAGVNPDVIVSSPASRAIETAKLVLEALGRRSEEIALEPGIYEAEPSQLLGIVKRLPGSAREAMIFGHNPGFESLAGALCEEFKGDMPTCAAFCVDLLSDSWTGAGTASAKLVFHMSPKD